MSDEIYTPILWDDKGIESVLYEISYQNRVSWRTTDLVRSKMTGMRNGYQEALRELFIERQVARQLLERAQIEIDLHTGDDKEMAQLNQDIRDYLRRG